MTWFVVDDGFYDHPKVIGLSDSAQALWVRAGSYCGKYLTDGFIGEAAVFSSVRGSQDAVDELIAAGLWHRGVGGYQFHDWGKYQQTREQVERRRASDKERKARSRSVEKSESPSSFPSPPFPSPGTRDSARRHAVTPTVTPTPPPIAQVLADLERKVAND